MYMSAKGRHVKHSRNGCGSCKKRRIRCPGEKPSCSRCIADSKVCEYVLRLQWEDDSIRRGVKHGRSAQVLPTAVTTSGRLLRPAKHFVNFSHKDFSEDDHVDTARAVVSRLYVEGAQSSSIPAALQPSFTFQNNLDAILFDYYINRICRHATLLDNTSNAYRQVVLPMSILQDSIRHLVLSLGALALDTIHPMMTTDLKAVALRHKHKALQHLRQDLTEPEVASSDHNLVAVQLMCVLDIADNCQVSWATHLGAAKTLLELQRNGQHRARDPTVVDFVSKFFVLKDSLGRSACGNGPKFELIPTTPSQEIDPSAGCSYELIKMIAEITDMSRSKIDCSITGSAAVETWEMNRAHLATRLEAISQVTPLGHGSKGETSTLLRDTSSFIHLAATIYFYTSLMPQALYIEHVQSLINTAMSIITSLYSHLRSQHLWPIFVTGLFTTDDSDRIVVLDAFEKIQRASPILSAGAAGRARSIVEAVWKKHDIVGTLSYENTWNGLVRRMSEGLSLG